MNENEVIRRFGEELEKCLMKSNGVCHIFLENHGCACRNAVIFKLLKQYREIGTPEEFKELKANALSGLEPAKMYAAIETLKKYETIGTPEECRAAVEKYRRRKPNTYANKYCITYHCPACNYDIRTYDDYCEHCGQAIDWSDAE